MNSTKPSGTAVRGNPAVNVVAGIACRTPASGVNEIVLRIEQIKYSAGIRRGGWDIVQQMRNQKLAKRVNCWNKQSGTKVTTLYLKTKNEERKKAH